MAPEILHGQAYTKSVDWWSYGTLMFEMFTGLPPFYSTDVQQMYTKIITAPLVIPDFISPEGRSILQGLLERDPAKRLGDAKIIKAHPFFRVSLPFACKTNNLQFAQGMDWQKLVEKEIVPPYIPPVGKDPASVEMIADEFKNQKVEMTYVENKLTTEQQANFKNFTYVSTGVLDQ